MDRGPRAPEGPWPTIPWPTVPGVLVTFIFYLRIAGANDNESSRVRSGERPTSVELQKFHFTQRFGR